MNKMFISLPYIYPVCPLSVDHARMFVIADVIARHSRLKGKDVIFPVASHYSGNTAQNIAVFFKSSEEDGGLDQERKQKRSLYRDFYGTPEYILKKFSDPVYLLDYFTQEILWELKSIKISADYKNFYTTKNEAFSRFVLEIISRYKDQKLLIKNKDKKTALDYDDEDWKEKASQLLSNTKFIHPSQKKVIESVIKNNNVRSDWEILRDNGFGVEYNGQVIDPMFDSELFTIFDLYMAHRNIPELKEFDDETVFVALFDRLSGKNNTNSNKLVECIIECLPCNVFICEEHLKNWVVKRLYAESLFLREGQGTESYFVTGMGLLEGKRMSASRGRAILTKDLIKEYGPWKSRLIMLMTGGHPSKVYQFDKQLPEQVDSMLEDFSAYLFFILASSDDINCDPGSELTEFSNKIDTYIEGGYFRQAIVELMTIIPKKYKKPSKHEISRLLAFYEKYLNIFVPGFLETFYVSNI